MERRFLQDREYLGFRVVNLMNIKALFQVVIGGVCTLMLIFLVVKGQLIDKKLEQIARPSHLFNLKYIESNMESRGDWEVRLSPDHDRFFYVVSQQALCWIGKGENSYIFRTSDEKYIVKFIHVGTMNSSQAHGFFKTLFAKNGKRNKKTSQFEDLFMSSRICFDEIQEETGVIYAHLNRTNAKIHGLKLIDSYGQSHRVCGDDTCFVVQQKASPLIPKLTDLMEKGNIEEAKTRVDQVFELLVSLAQKGFVDGDDGLILNNNIGFTDNRAIYLDTWHFFRAKKLDVLERMRYETQLRLVPLEYWLNATYPELGAYYVQKREHVLAALTGGKTVPA
jgi:hypothetical protein